LGFLSIHDPPIGSLILSWFVMAHSERLAQMYILKIRHPAFNSNAGAVWRQLFVLAMVPWMRKHRVFSDERALQAVEALAQHKLEVEEDNMGFAERLGGDVQALVPDVAAQVVSSAEGHVITRVTTPAFSPSSKPVDENPMQVGA
jgi:hypothetical protein